MSLRETLGLILGALEQAGITHMIAGSAASTMHSEPRATRDIDIVVDPVDLDSLDDFVAALDSARFYVSDHRTAFEARRMFNVVDSHNGWKVDLIIRHDRPFSRTEFERRIDRELDGVEVKVATAEDVILSKLEWARLGESERQIRDVTAVVRANRAQLDEAYLHRWASELGLTTELERILDAT